MKDDKVIKKLVLQLSGKEISLSTEEAQKLYEALSELFAQKVVEKHIHHYDWWRWSYPVTYPLTVTGTTTVASGWLDTVNGTTATPLYASNGTQFSYDARTLNCNLLNS